MKYLLSFIIFCWLILIPQPVSALRMDGRYPDCTGTCSGEPPPTCWNGPRVGDSGGCGLACDWGSAWEKHYPVCKKVSSGTEIEQCEWVWVVQRCLTSDTCYSGEKGLRPGTCDCTVGSNIYKTCCNGNKAESCSGGEYTGYCPHTWVWGSGQDSDCVGLSSPSPTSPSTPPPSCNYSCSWRASDCGGESWHSCSSTQKLEYNWCTSSVSGCNNYGTNDACKNYCECGASTDRDGNPCPLPSCSNISINPNPASNGQTINIVSNWSDEYGIREVRTYISNRNDGTVGSESDWRLVCQNFYSGNPKTVTDTCNWQVNTSLGTHLVQVNAFDNLGVSRYGSGSCRGSLVVREPPCEITNATCGSSTSSSITINNITWNRANLNEKMFIQRGRDIIYEGNFSSSYQDNNLQSSTTYNYWLGCYYENPGGGKSYYGTFGPINCSTTNITCSSSTDTQPPPAPTISASNTCSSVTFSWTQVEDRGCLDNVSYWLQVWDSEGVWYFNGWTNNLSYTINNLIANNNKTYFAQVKAGDTENGNHPNQSDWVQTQIKITDNTPPPIPNISCSLTGRGENNSCNFFCQWSSNQSQDQSCDKNYTYNEVFRSSTGTWERPGTNQFDPSTSTDVRGVSNGDTLYAKARAKDNLGNTSAYSSEIAVSCPFIDSNVPFCTNASINPLPPQRVNTQINFNFTAYDNNNLSSCSLLINNSQISSQAISGTSTDCSLSWMPNTSGVYNYETKISDSQNNISTCQSGSYCIDSLAPPKPNRERLTCSYQETREGRRYYAVSYSWEEVSDRGCAGLHPWPYWAQIWSGSTAYYNNIWGSQDTEVTINNIAEGTSLLAHVQSRDLVDNQSDWTSGVNLVVNSANCSGVPSTPTPTPILSAPVGTCGVYNPATGTTPITWSWSQGNKLQVWDSTGEWWYNSSADSPITISSKDNAGIVPGIPPGRRVFARVSFDWINFSQEGSITCLSSTPTSFPSPTLPSGPTESQCREIIIKDKNGNKATSIVVGEVYKLESKVLYYGVNSTCVFGSGKWVNQTTESVLNVKNENLSSSWMTLGNYSVPPYAWIFVDFTPTVSGRLDKVDVYLKGGGAVYVALQKTDGTFLAENRVFAPTNPGWATVKFDGISFPSGTLDLQAGTTYRLNFRKDPPSGGNPQWMKNTYRIYLRQGIALEEHGRITNVKCQSDGSGSADFILNTGQNGEKITLSAATRRTSNLGNLSLNGYSTNSNIRGKPLACFESLPISVPGNISGTVKRNDQSQICSEGEAIERKVTISRMGGSPFTCEVLSRGGFYTSDDCPTKPATGYNYQVTVDFDANSESCIGDQACPSAGCSQIISLSSVSATANFTIFSSKPPWFQAKGGDIHSNNEIRNTVPQNLETPLLLEPDGVVSSGRPLGLGIFGSKISFSGWQVAHETETRASFGANNLSFNFDFFAQKLEGEEILPFEGRKPPKSGIYRAQGDWEITEEWQINLNQKIIILIDGKLTTHNKITVEKGGFLAFIVKGDIVIDENLGVDPSSNRTVLEGVFITDSFFRSVPEDKIPNKNKKLVAAGIFIADADLNNEGGFDLRRDLGQKNNQFPAEFFEYRPDFLVNFYQKLASKKIIFWREVAP